ncbi:MFS transporter [Anaerovibrio sp.]|uniref:MFS transporter n=1 Tax=Anaerovibrio sp. TaxID=1872532 RepID=UPI003F141C99
MREDNNPSAGEILEPGTARRLFLAVMITSFIGPFGTSGMNVAVPAIGQEFGATANALSWVVFGFLLGSAMFILPTGKLADIFGRRRVYYIGQWLFSLTFLAGAFATSIEMLNVIRFIEGSVMSLIFGPGMALLVSSHPPTERGKVIGYSAASTYSGLSLGPVISGFLCELIGWRSIFLATAAVVLISVWLVSGIHQEWYGDKGAKFDFKGSLCYTVAAPLLLYGLAEINTSDIGKVMLALGVLGMLLFALIEYRSGHPCLDIRIFQGNRVFTFSNLAAMLHYSATFAISFLMSLYLQIILGFSASAAGGIILLQPVVMALLSPKAGALSDRIHPGKVASVGMAITCLGLLLMSFLDAETPIWHTGLILMLVGLGFALFSSPNNNAIMGAVPPKYYGTTSSLVSTMRLFGQSISMALVTMLLAWCGVQSLTGGDNVHLQSAIQVTFRVFCLLSFIGIGMSLARNK